MKTKILNQLYVSLKQWKTLVLIGLLLTLGVGQMWAYNFYSPYIYFNNADLKWGDVMLLVGHGSYSCGYNATTNMISNTKLVYFAPDASWSDQDGFTVCNTTGWDCRGDAFTTRAGYTTHIGLKYSYGFNWHESYYVTGNTSGTINITSGRPGSLNATQGAKWRDTGTSYSNTTGTWPASLKLKGTYISGDGTSAQSEITSTKSSDGADKKTYGAVVTGKITHSYASLNSSYYFEGWGTGSTPSVTTATHEYYISAATTTYAFFSKKYTLTYDVKGTYGTSTLSVDVASFSGTKTSGSSIPTGHTITFTASPATGYEVEGWYSDASCTSAYTSGSGGVTISGSGNVTFTLSSLDANKSVYCKFKKKNTTITLSKNAPGGQTVSGASSVTATYYEVLPSFTALSCTGDYALTGYWTSSSSGTKIINADGTLVRNTTYATDESTPVWKSTSASVTLHAQWSLDRTLTYDGNGSTSGSVPAAATTYANGASVTVLGNTNSLKKTGYTFTGWNTQADGNGTPYSAGNSITMNANYTLFAQWSENMTTVTISASPAGTGTFTVDGVSGTSASVGVTTTATIVATAATDFQFSSWAATNCSASPTNNKTTTLTGNGSSATGTLVATFTENVASGWYLGGSSPFGNSWDTSNKTYPMNKKYRGMDGVFYRSGTVTTNGYYTIHNGTTRYRPSTGANATFSGAGYANKINMSNTSADANFRFSAAGTYYIIADTRGSTPVIWYETSEPTRFNYHTVNVTGVDNAKGPCKVTLNSNGFETTRFANGETFKITITGVSGYIPTITIGGVATTFWKEAASYTATGTMSTSDVSVTISYTASYTVTFAKTTGCKSVTATGPSSTTITTGTKVKSGTSITFTQENSTGYTFSKWYSTSSGTGGTQHGTASSLTKSITAATSVYPIYTENMTTVTLAASPTGKGSFTIGGAAATTTTAGVTTTRSVTAVPATGYRVNTSATVWSSSNANITLNNATANPVTVTGAGSGGTSTLTATFTPITYTIHFNGNGSTSGSMTNQTGVTYDAATTIKANAFSRTGYTFQGWATSQSRANDGTVDRTDGAAHSNLTSEQDATVQLWAVWQAKTYTVNLDRSGTGHGSGGSSSVTATYDADMPAMTSPTADNGYAFMGYYTAEDGGGTQYYKANGTSAKTWDIDVNPTTLYAWFKKAEITELTFDPAIVAPNTTIKVTPTIAPTPTGDTHIEWRVLYDNNNPLAPQPTLTTYGSGKQFTSMAESGIYKVEATLRTGTVDGAGTVLHTKVASFQVAGNHTVTVRYKCGDYVVAAPTSVTGYPLDWSSDITAPAVTGYTFQYWTLGDGITIKDGQSTGDEDTPGTNPIKIKATYDGTLTANYVKKQMIYFNNTLGWSNVYVYFYDNGDYWDPNDNGKGAGAQHNYAISGHSPHWYHFWGAMTRIEGTNIWYLDYQAMAQSIDPGNAGLINGYTTVAFTKDAQGYIDSSHDGYEFFDDTEAAFRTDFNHALSMYVPQNSGVEEKNKHDGKKTKYYNRGYWMNYPENTGYWLKIFDKKANDGTDPIIVKDIPFEFTADYTMPMDLTVDLEAGKTYGFKLYRVDNMWYGNNSTMTANTTNWKMDENTSNCGLQTTAAGNYKFNLYFLDDNNDGEYRYRVGVTYPVGTGDFRIVYTDGAKWSQSSAHGASWSHPSAIITKNSSSTAAKRDTVSFYWAYGSSPAIKSQKCSSVGTGTVSWGSTTSISVSGYSSVLNKKGVYNFIFEQPQNGGSISLVGVEPYTGDFYIRTDCAGSTKWDNYKALDHMMQYSDYAANNEDFTHYYAHWVERSKNIKFVIANDYSPCVSDTLVQDVDVNFGNMESDGTLKSDGAGEAFRDKYSANIRFMYDVNNNKLSRAYISSATDIAKKFLVMRGNSASGEGHIFNEAGQELTTAGGGKIADLDEYEMSFVDDQNFIYETKIKANPTALVKLYAKYCGKSQELKGDTSATFSTTDNHAIEILGGTYAAATKELMRIVYDFKTNRLVCAWLPSDSEISGELDINADVMVIREHQEEAQQIKFADTGDKLSEVKSVYGVMRFNRWTLANKDKNTHNPLASPKSNYERQIYFISFPFDVNLGDIFGLSAYDDLWWIEYYDGAERAEKGYFQETKSFWKFMENTPTAKLEANKGYLLKLDAAMLNSSNTNIWTNNIEQVELFFPSASEVTEIEKKEASITLASLTCTKNINPAGSKEPGQTGYDAEKDRRKRDSHWHCIGVPSYANYSEYVTDADGNNLSWSKWGPTNEGSFPFLYTWNMTDNTLSPTASAKYGFKTMNAYMVQYAGTIKWSAASAPKSIAARRNANWKSSYMFRLELQKENQKTEQTLINLRDDDNVSAAFDFNYDLSNEGGAIYTTTSDLVTVAGNCLPLETEQQTTVPVGVVAKTTGEYTFAMPDGTEGLSVVLVDNETGTHTNLAWDTYTVALEAGTYEGRFSIVIDPRTSATAIDTVGGEGNDAAARKVFINGLMYIQRGEHLYDAQGRKVE